jgi:rhodanese-related sulfurtransferase
VGAAGLIIATTLAAAIFSTTREKPLESPFDELRTILAERAEKSAGEDSEIPLSTLLNVLEIPQVEKRVADIKLEEEIAYSIGRNNNVIWNRYLSAGKVPTDQSTLDAMARGAYEIRFEELFENGRISPKFSIVDLRTPLEFGTSAHFKDSKNVEYRTIVNDEAAFEKGVSYVFICHDGAADLSRSLIATAYLRSKGYSAYALKTGMNPILKRL